MKRIATALVLSLFFAVTYAQTSSKIRLHEPYKIYAQDGGKRVYLGRLARPSHPESIFNSFSQYGNKNDKSSIWNGYGTYGNKFSTRSPWNEFSSTPPMLVNKNNEVVGYFTTNESKCVAALIPVMKYMKKNLDKCASKPESVYKMFFY